MDKLGCAPEPLFSPLPMAQSTQAHGFAVPFLVNRDRRDIAQLLLLLLGDIPLMPFSKWLVGTSVPLPRGSSVGWFHV